MISLITLPAAKHKVTERAVKKTFKLTWETEADITEAIITEKKVITRLNGRKSFMIAEKFIS